MTDPIADMFNRIRNAQAVAHPTVDIPFSKIKYKIAEIFEKNGFIQSVEKKGKKLKKIIRITLKYRDKFPEISGLKKVSKSGQRIYLPSEKLKSSKGKYGMLIVSTSKGLMINRQARKENLGGEVICEIW